MHPIHKEVGEIAKKVGGHGGMDFVMDYRLVYCLLNGLPLDMDVYLHPRRLGQDRRLPLRLQEIST